MNFYHASKQKSYLTFNQDELANLALPVSTSEEVRTAGRASVIQAEAYSLGGDGAQNPDEEFRPKQTSGERFVNFGKGAHFVPVTSLISRVSR